MKFQNNIFCIYVYFYTFIRSIIYRLNIKIYKCIHVISRQSYGLNQNLLSILIYSFLPSSQNICTTHFIFLQSTETLIQFNCFCLPNISQFHTLFKISCRKFSIDTKFSEYRWSDFLDFKLDTRDTKELLKPFPFNGRLTTLNPLQVIEILTFTL